MDARGARGAQPIPAGQRGLHIQWGNLDWQAAGGQTNLYLLDLTDNK